MALKTSPIQFFQQALDQYNDPTAVPPFQSPYQPPDLTPDFGTPNVAGEPYQGMDPAEMDAIHNAATGMDIAKSFSPRPSDAQVPTPPTPWFVKALGGVQDALALVSHIQKGTPQYSYIPSRSGRYRKVITGYSKPQSDAEFGGLAKALLGAKMSANAETLKNKSEAAAYDKNMAQLGQAIALRTVAGTIAGEKKQPGDVFAEQVDAMPISANDKQMLKLARLRKEAGIKPASGGNDVYKGPTEQVIAKLKAKAAATEDPDEKQALLDQVRWLDETFKKRQDIRTAGKIEVKKTPGAAPIKPTAEGELPAGQKRMMDAELAGFKDNETSIRKQLEQKKKNNAARSGIPELQDLAGEKDLQEQLDAIQAKQKAVRDKYIESAKPPLDRVWQPGSWSWTKVK